MRPKTETMEVRPDADGVSRIVLRAELSAGYVWQIESRSGDAELKAAAVDRLEECDEGASVGGGFDMDFELKGSGSVVLVLRRPWEKDAAPWRRVAVRIVD
jgi:predicted secreted protein